MATKKTAGLSSEAVVSSILTDDMFVTGNDIIEHEVTLGDGSKRTMYFKPISALEWKQHVEAENSKDKDVRVQSAARLIAKCLVEPNGRRALTPQQAARLKPAVSGAFFLAILEINDILKKRAENSADDHTDDDIIDDEDDEDGEIDTDSGN